MYESPYVNVFNARKKDRRGGQKGGRKGAERNTREDGE